MLKIWNWKTIKKVVDLWELKLFYLLTDIFEIFSILQIFLKMDVEQWIVCSSTAVNKIPKYIVIEWKMFNKSEDKN
jgi:hypothetical protein